MVIMKEHAALIEQLGGPPKVAKALGLKSNVVCNWKDRGIPYRRRAAVLRLATAHDLRLPSNFLDSEAT